jgi:site-specific DNA recombinase
MATKRVAIYARVSTERQEREGTSLESQVLRCRAYAEDQGWAAEYVVEEQGSGGDISGRPKLEGLLAAAQMGHFDVLICYHIDRLSRDVDDQGWLRREFRLAQVELVLVTGHQDQMVQAVEGIAAMQERKQIRERIARGKATTAMRGQYLPGGTPPFGYRHRLELVRTKSQAVERVVGLDEDPETALMKTRKQP